MKRKFTFLIAAAVMLLTMMASTTMWGQSDYSTTYSSNCTLTAGTNGSACQVTIGGTSYAGIKVGTGSNGGDMSVTVPAGAKYLHIHVAAWNGVTGLSLNITPNTNISPTSIGLTANAGISNNSPFAFSGDPSTSDYYKVITFTNALTESTTLTFTTSSKKRFVIWGVNPEEAGSNPPSGDPIITLSDSGTGNIGNYATNTAIYRDFTVTQSNLTDDISLNATNGGTFTIGDEVVTSIPASDEPLSTVVRWHFTTPEEAGQFTSKITATSGETSATCTYMGYAFTSHNVNITQGIEHGTVEADPTSGIQGTYITLTVTPDQGYELEELTVLDGNNNEIEVNDLNRFQMPDSDVTVSATFVEASPTTIVTDELTYSLIGVTGTSYSEWSGKTSNSDAVYAGQSAGGNSSIQLRATSPAGIISTTSGGKVKKVTVTWNSNTSGRTLDIYGSNTAYTASSELYSSTTQGTKLGSISSNNNAPLNITGDYAYIGLRSNSGAMYIDKIEIDWETSGTPTCVVPTFTPAAGAVLSGTTVAISTTTDGATIYYTMGANPDDPTTSSSVYSTPIEITEATTIKAMAVKDGYNNSTISSAAYTVVTPYTTIPAIFAKATEVGSTQTNIYVSFNDWIVVGKYSSHAYVSDGQYGLHLFKSGGTGFEVGDKLSGTVATKVQLYTGGAELVDLTSSTPELTVTHNQSFEPYAISLADVFGQGIYYGSYVDLGNLTYTNGSKFSDGNGHEITPNNSLNITGYPTLEAGKTYHVKGVYIQYNSTTKHIAPVYASDFTEYSGPSITLTPAAANPFTYVENQGPSAQQDFTVALENETSNNVTATITTGTDYFEIKNGENWASATTINIDNTNTISVRMKAGLALGNNYAGVMTLTNEDATDVVVNLSGSVTGSTYTIEQYSSPAMAHGTITFAPSATVEAGTEVTLTATPDAGYDFTANSWVFYKQSGEDIVVDESIVATNNVITMPAYDIWVDATFTAKPTYAITCVANPVAGGIIEASPASAYQGQTVTLSYVPETGYNLVKIKITKTSDGSITGITPVASGDNFTFTMPAYAVTATASFVPNTYAGNFVKFTGDIAEGDYLLVYNGYAMNDTISNNRFGPTSVNVSNNIVSDPSSAIVWHIAPIAETEYWTIYSAAKDQYANATGSSTNVSLVDVATYAPGAQWKVTVDQSTYDFRCKANEGQSTTRYIRMYNDVFGHYAALNGGALTLYKYTELTESTITFNGNGGTFNQATTYTQNVYNGVATALNANQFTKANSLFAGWALTADGDVEYADQAEVTINANLNLFAKWNVSYTAMADDQIVGGTVLINGEEIVEAAEGTEMTLTYSANVGYAFSEWNVYNANDPTITVNVENNTFTMPAYDVIVSATFGEVTTYSLITNVSQIVSGKHYIIASGTNGSVRVMAEQKDNNRTSVAATATTGVISETEGIYEFVINGPETITVNDEQVSVYTIYDASYPGFLYAASSSSNYLRTRGTNTNGNSQWTVAVTAEGVATIKSQGNFTRNWMRNNGNIFACYESGQADIYLFVKNNDNDLEFYGNVTYAAAIIPDGQTITIGEGSVMTVPDSFVNDDPAALIIEEGGQLIHPSDVQATVQKSVAAYTAKDGDGWYLIASPVDELSTSGLITEPATSYDLFIYNEPNAYWYSNIGTGAPFDILERGKGYLYANANNIDLDFAGLMIGTETEVTKTLSFAYDGGGDLKGYNLMGNPFTRNLGAGDITLGGKPVTSVLLLNNDEDYQTCNFLASGVIKPGQGFFIQAESEGQQLVFNPSSSKDANEIGLISIEAGDENYIDKAFIQFGGGNTLRKMTFGENTMVYVMNDDLDYAAARVEELAGTMPVHFVPIEDGFYTITVETKNIENLNYMHLIDNIKNTEIDLLVEPSYTFKASESDNADRFYLVFDFNNYTGVNENYTNDNFAHQIGDEIFVSGEGTLQVFDVLGRFVTGYNVNGDKRISTAEFNTGVYIFRMVGTEVKTQKIIVR